MQVKALSFKELVARTALPKLLLEAGLKPSQGARFTVANYPNSGPATFVDCHNKNGVVVERQGSMANHLEKYAFDESTLEQVEALKGLPYIRVVDADGSLKTTSIVEPHRAGSVYIQNSLYQGEEGEGIRTAYAVLGEIMGIKPNALVSYKGIITGLALADFHSLVHGVMLVKLHGRVKLSRALSVFLEATDVNMVAEGGVKFNALDPTGDSLTSDDGETGKGNVIFYKESTAGGKIVIYINFDLEQISSYSVSYPGQEDKAAEVSENIRELVYNVAWYKILRLLNGNIRLRSECDLVVEESLHATNTEGFVTPTLPEVIENIAQLTAKCSDFFALGAGLRTVSWNQAVADSLLKEEKKAAEAAATKVLKDVKKAADKSKKGE